jgi:hypothetical protein
MTVIMLSVSRKHQVIKMQITDEPKAFELHNNITLWLQDNRHLPIEELAATVKLMLEGAEPTVLLHYAAYSFIFNDVNAQKMEADDELDSINKELEIARNAEDKARRVNDLVTNAIISVTTDHFKTVSTQRKTANGKRVENYKVIKDKLKQHWQKNISPDKKATQAAIMLERTDIYINSTTQPTRAVLERYVREWQAEQK